MNRRCVTLFESVALYFCTKVSDPYEKTQFISAIPSVYSASGTVGGSRPVHP